jgi:hypothetical protein
VRIALSQRRLDEAATAYGAGNCPAAVADARASLSALGRPEPLGIVAVCDSRRGLQRPALRAIDGALARDRGSWAWRYERGVILGRLGRDPRPDLRAASAMYPRNLVLGAMVAAAEAAGSPARRRQVSRQLLDVRFAGL